MATDHNINNTLTLNANPNWTGQAGFLTTNTINISRKQNHINFQEINHRISILQDLNESILSNIWASTPWFLSHNELQNHHLAWTAEPPSHQCLKQIYPLVTDSSLKPPSQHANSSHSHTVGNAFQAEHTKWMVCMVKMTPVLAQLSF